MGNGNNRNRRGGARTRHGPHRGGAGNSANRSATHVMPSALQATEVAEAASGDITPGEEAPARDIPPRVEAADKPVAGVDAAPVASEEAPGEPESEQPDTPAEQAAAEAPDEAPEPAPAPESERPAPRGRFERFYAPGQGMRAERNGGRSAAELSASRSALTPGEANGANGTNGAHGDHGASGTTDANQPPPSREAIPGAPTPHTALAAHLSDADDDDVTAPSAPREDVRGAVGGLIDSLHDLFTHDRGIASQGGISRCGICYLHFPANELTYREAEGFYVCESCGQALGVGRIVMVRRQQRL